MGICQTKEEIQSQHEFRLSASKKDNSDAVMLKDDLAGYIERHAALWAMLAVNCNLDEAVCKDIAGQVAFQLANTTAEEGMNLQQFHDFRINYIENPKGSLEFFQRTVFQVYDKDNNGALDSRELDEFVNLFYEANSVFAGDVRLPTEKEELKRVIQKRFDSDCDGLLTFTELRQVIAGKADLCNNFSVGVTKKADGATRAGVGAGAETGAETGAEAGAEAGAGGSETDSKNLRSVDGRTPYV